MEYEYAVDIAAPAKRVWEVLVDVESWPEWTESMDRIERLDADPFGVGSKARVRQPRGQPMIWTVTELEPERSFTWGASTTGVRIDATHRLTQRDGQVHAVLGLSTTGWLAPVVMPLIGERIRGYVRMEAEGLKKRSVRVAQD